MKNFNVDTMFSDRSLTGAVTMAEAQLLWNVSRRTIWWAIHRDHVSARKSITGGSWIINYQSLVEHFGSPVYSIEEWMV